MWHFSSMYSRLISYRHKDTTLYPKCYFYNMKILRSPLCWPLFPGWAGALAHPLNSGLCSKGWHRGFDLIARAQCGCQAVVRDLVWLLHLKLNGLYCAFCALLSSLWDPAVLEALSDVPMSLLIMFYRIQINQMFFSRILLLQQPCYHGFSQTQ